MDQDLFSLLMAQIDLMKDEASCAAAQSEEAGDSQKVQIHQAVAAALQKLATLGQKMQSAESAQAWQVLHEAYKLGYQSKTALEAPNLWRVTLTHDGQEVRWHGDSGQVGYCFCWGTSEEEALQGLSKLLELFGIPLINP